MTVLIAGCGDLGTEAGLRFAAAGHRVVGWRRSPSKLPAVIQGLAADLTGHLPPVPPHTDVVIYAAAAERRSEEAYRAAYADGLANVLDALKRDDVHPRRVLFVSSTAVYGERDGWVDEESPAGPTTATAAIIREAEELLHSRTAGGQFETGTALRLAGIYGPGRTRLIDQVRSGTAVLPPGPQFTNRIHRDDAAAALVHLAGMTSPPGSAYIGVDSEPAELGEVLAFLADELGLPRPPAQPAEPAAEPPRTKRCSNRRLLDTGFRFRYPTFREGYRAVLAGEGVRHP